MGLRLAVLRAAGAPLLTKVSRSVWENLDLGRVYRSHCVRSVLTTSVKILPYRPPARLIRAKYYLEFNIL